MTSVTRVVFFLFSVHKIVRPPDADKIANLAKHSKSLGTAGLDNNSTCAGFTVNC